MNKDDQRDIEDLADNELKAQFFIHKREMENRGLNTLQEGYNE